MAHRRTIELPQFEPRLPADRLPALWLVTAALLAGAAPAAAQVAAPAPSPGQVTPDRLRPPAEPQREQRVLPPPPVPADRVPDAGDLTVRITAVTVEGDLAELADETARLVAPYGGRTTSIRELFALAGEIEAAYARRGYVLARVTVPPQQLSDGSSARLVVIDGFIEDVHVSGVPASVRAAVRARAARLVGRRGLTLRDIERPLVLAGEVPGVRLRSALATGQKPGGTRLVLEADYQPVTASLTTSNRLGDEYRNWDVGAQFALNSLLGAGEQLYGVLIFHPGELPFASESPRSVAGAGLLLPLGADGLRLNPEFTIAETNPRLGPGAPRIRGRYRRFAMSMSYPVVRTRSESLDLAVGFEAVDEHQRALAFNTRISDDRLRNLTARLDWTRAWADGGSIAADGLVKVGVDGLGARNAADAARSGVPLSRLGSSPDFGRIEGRVRLVQPIAGGPVVTAVARGQVSLSGALPSSEQFALSAPDGLSTFPTGRITGDSGWTLRGELGYQIALGQTGSITPYAFGAAGQAHLSQPTALERRTTTAYAYGGGLRAFIGFTGRPGGFFVGAEAGRATSNGSVPDRTRVMFEAGVRF